MPKLDAQDKNFIDEVCSTEEKEHLLFFNTRGVQKRINSQEEINE